MPSQTHKYTVYSVLDKAIRRHSGLDRIRLLGKELGRERETDEKYDEEGTWLGFQQPASDSVFSVGNWSLNVTFRVDEQDRRSERKEGRAQSEEHLLPHAHHTADSLQHLRLRSRLPPRQGRLEVLQGEEGRADATRSPIPSSSTPRMQTGQPGQRSQTDFRLLLPSLHKLFSLINSGIYCGIMGKKRQRKKFTGPSKNRRRSITYERARRILHRDPWKRRCVRKEGP